MAAKIHYYIHEVGEIKEAIVDQYSRTASGWPVNSHL